MYYIDLPSMWDKLLSIGPILLRAEIGSNLIAAFDKAWITKSPTIWVMYKRKKLSVSVVHMLTIFENSSKHSAKLTLNLSTHSCKNTDKHRRAHIHWLKN